MPTREDISRTIEVLKSLTEKGELLAALSEEQRRELMTAAGQLSRPNRLEHRIRSRAMSGYRSKQIKTQDRMIRASTGIREARTAAVFQAPKQLPSAGESSAEDKARVLSKPRNCYVCKAEYTRLHFFYDSMCADCADFNYQKRFQTASLEGKTALITGSRLKIGYQSTLMMLRAGARVIATTRFPVDSALRFSKEEDFQVWGHRLDVYGLDLRHTPSVEIFAKYVEHNYERLDILINNAAQTVRRPPGFYAHLMANEKLQPDQLPPAARSILKAQNNLKMQLSGYLSKSDQGADSAQLVAWHGQGPGIGLRSSAELSQIPYTYDQSLVADEVFPEGKLDADLQQVDLRTVNSWRLRLADVPTPELLEVQLVNSIAPFVLCAKLAPLMRRDNTGQKHIVNVTAMEGKFSRYTKTDCHPHTNMAKAALNMLTHTSAKDLAKDGIYMNAVDTGWVTDEDPAQLSKQKQDMHDFQPPLDIVDGAARVCDPFFHGILSGQHWCGKFLKDYKPTEW